MKRLLLSSLLLVTLIHAPWRLMTLAVEALVLMPGPIRTTDVPDRYWETRALAMRLQRLGWAVGYAALIDIGGNRVYGITDYAAHTITIEQTLSWHDRFVTLAHEGGHVLQPWWMTRQQEEMFAESVAMLIARDGIREHARYLASYRMELVWFLGFEWPAVMRAAAVLEY